MITFENYDRKIEKINKALAAYGIASLEDAEKLCKEKGIEASRAYVSAVLSFPSSTASSYLEVELLDSDGSKAADVGVAYSLDYGTCTVVPLESLTGGSEKPERIERGGDAL